jgi:hypothetical protein
VKEERREKSQKRERSKWDIGQTRQNKGKVRKP